MMNLNVKQQHTPTHTHTHTHTHAFLNSNNHAEIGKQISTTETVLIHFM